MGRFEMEIAAMQRAQFAQRCAATCVVDPVERPSVAGTSNVVAQRIAAGARASDADDAIPRRRQQAGDAGLADAQRLPQGRSGQWAVAVEQVFQLHGSGIRHAPIE